MWISLIEHDFIAWKRWSRRSGHGPFAFFFFVLPYFWGPLLQWNDLGKLRTYRNQRFGGFLKWGYPQIIHFNRIFHHNLFILGYPHFRKPPFESLSQCFSVVYIGYMCTVHLVRRSCFHVSPADQLESAGALPGDLEWWGPRRSPTDNHLLVPDESDDHVGGSVWLILGVMLAFPLLIVGYCWPRDIKWLVYFLCDTVTDRASRPQGARLKEDFPAEHVRLKLDELGHLPSG